MAKRGLIVTYYFPPSGGGGVQRWTKFIKYLSRLNWKFTVITSAADKAELTDESLLTDIPAGTNIIRTHSDPDSGSRLARKIPHGYPQRWLSAFLHITDSRRRWNNSIIPLIDEEIAHNIYDVIFFSIPPYSLAEPAAGYSAQLDIPVILDMRDPWFINPYKIHPTPLHRHFDKISEKKSISALAYIVSAYQSIIDDYRKFSHINTCVIPNGYDEEDFNDLRPVKLNRQPAFNLAFSGSFYSHLNKPDRLLQAIKILKNRNIEIIFHHIGSGVIDLKKLAAGFGVAGNIRQWGYKPHKECLAVLAAMDAYCVLLDPEYKNADKTIGGKVYEYLRLRKPIIGIVPAHGEAAGLIRKTASGIICSENTPEQIARCLDNLISGRQSFSFKNIEQFERSAQSRILDDFIEQLGKK